MDVLNKKAICQSCGRPMKKETDFGTEAEGNLNEEYCKHCYNKGNFTDEDITLEEKTKN